MGSNLAFGLAYHRAWRAVARSRWARKPPGVRNIRCTGSAVGVQVGSGVQVGTVVGVGAIVGVGGVLVHPTTTAHVAANPTPTASAYGRSWRRYGRQRCIRVSVSQDLARRGTKQARSESSRCPEYPLRVFRRGSPRRLMSPRWRNLRCRRCAGASYHDCPRRRESYADR